MKSLFLSLCLAAGALAAPAAHSATLMNGSFEEPGLFTGGYQTIGTGGAGLSDWTVTTGSIDLINTYWQASDGRYSLDMSGNEKGAISQLITDLTIGRSYRLSFDMSGNPDSGPVVKTMKVSVGGDSKDFTYDVGGISKADMRYKTKFMSFVANSTSALLTFTSTTDGPWGPALDNVEVAEVPLPAGAPLLAGALLGLGLLRRRRKV